MNISIYFFAIYLWIYCSIFCHEMGHFLAAKLVGMSPYYIKIGTGYTLLKFELFKIKFEFNHFPFGAITYADFLSPKNIKFKVIIFSLGGACANLILLLIAVQFAIITQNPFFIAPIFIEVIFLYCTLFPMTVKTNGVEQNNDGKQILNAISTNYEQLFETIQSEYHKVLFHYESDPEKLPKTFLNNDLRILQTFIRAQNKLTQGFISEAIQLFFQVLDFPKISNTEKAFVLDYLACIVVINGHKEYLPEADQWTQTALTLASNSSTLKGTRGAVLIELGQYAQGKALLLPLTQPGNPNSDIAISSCYLAKAEYYLGNFNQVEKWITHAEQHQVDPSLLSRIQAEIQS